MLEVKNDLKFRKRIIFTVINYNMQCFFISGYGQRKTKENKKGKNPGKRNSLEAQEMAAPVWKDFWSVNYAFQVFPSY